MLITGKWDHPYLTSTKNDAQNKTLNYSGYWNKKHTYHTQPLMCFQVFSGLITGKWDHPYVYLTLVPIMGGVAYASGLSFSTHRHTHSTILTITRTLLLTPTSLFPLAPPSLSPSRSPSLSPCLFSSLYLYPYLSHWWTLSRTHTHTNTYLHAHPPSLSLPLSCSVFL